MGGSAPLSARSISRILTLTHRYRIKKRYTTTQPLCVRELAGAVRHLLHHQAPKQRRRRRRRGRGSKTCRVPVHPVPPSLASPSGNPTPATSPSPESCTGRLFRGVSTVRPRRRDAITAAKQAKQAVVCIHYLPQLPTKWMMPNFNKN